MRVHVYVSSNDTVASAQNGVLAGISVCISSATYYMFHRQELEDERLRPFSIKKFCVRFVDFSLRAIGSWMFYGLMNKALTAACGEDVIVPLTKPDFVDGITMCIAWTGTVVTLIHAAHRALVWGFPRVFTPLTLDPATVLAAQRKAQRYNFMSNIITELRTENRQYRKRVYAARDLADKFLLPEVAEIIYEYVFIPTRCSDICNVLGPELSKSFGEVYCAV